MYARMICTLSLLALLLGPIWGTSAAARAGDAETLVKQYLDQRGAHDYTIVPINEDYVTNVFPNVAWFGVFFRQYPQPIAPPDGLVPSNVFYVKNGRQVGVMTKPKKLKYFFFHELGIVSDQDTALDVGRSYLRITEDFTQDLYYTFSSPEVIIQDNVVVGQVRVTSGGRGQIQANLIFDNFGYLIDVNETRGVMIGVRPICQATKLLDADSLVRRMAEQDLRVMGSTAKKYLDEQRAKAKPDLRQAIDRIWKQIQEDEKRVPR